MTRRAGGPDDERRRLFRRMAWTFVWGPPVVAFLVAVFGGWVVAWLVEVPGTTFAARWVAVVLILLGIPIVGHLIQRLRE